MLVNRVKAVITKYPLLRGVLSYAATWPVSSAVQQVIEGKKLDEFDWWRCVRFGLYGGFYVAPTLYAWIKVSTAMWPSTNIKTAVAKSIVEQFSYTPAALSSFLFIMSLLEFKTFKEAAAEVETKFFPTYKVAVCVWPIIGTINFSLISEKNRVPFISMCSLVWATFLAYVKHSQTLHVENKS